MDDLNQSHDGDLKARVDLIPIDKGLAGPITAARWRRALLIYAAIFVCGTGLAWTAPPQWASLGLGLIFPGGGFLFHAAETASLWLHAAMFGATVLLFLLGLLLWAATGNLAAPVLIWIGTAIGAAAMDHWSIGGAPLSVLAMCRAGLQSVAAQWADARLWLPVAILGLIGTGYWSIARRKPWLARERIRINAYLARPRYSYATSWDSVSNLPKVEALSARDLETMRFVLDRALQPVSEFNGFDRIDEFRESAKRYQICIMSYMLGIQNFTRMPAFRGYVSEAQERLSLRMMDHRVWSYWRIENLWGNLRADPNPLARDNIMYYGWYGAMLGMHLCNTGDERFAAPASIRLEHPSGRVYESSFRDICEITLKNMQGSDFCLFPCEPRWIYPMCNNFGALSLLCHDRVYGSSLWESIRERYRRGLEDEFVTMNGRITAIRDVYTGITIPAMTATMADAVTALFLHPVLPGIARRSWEIIRNDLIDVIEGRVHLKTNGWDKIDFGNYRRSLFSTYALVAASAREMGDEEVAQGLLARIDEEFPSRLEGGVRYHPGGSVGAHAVLLGARVLRGNGMHDLVARGRPDAWKRGPLLQDAEYPKVLVAGAVSDGQMLELTLAPGSEKGRQTISLSQLIPDRAYRLSGCVEDTVRASPQGGATLTVDLDTMTQIRVNPLH